MSTLPSKPNNERVSDARLAELANHYEQADKQHNGWWVAVYWCLRELQERRSNETFDDSATLVTLADKLRAIAIRDGYRGFSTTGLENAVREIEWVARRDRGSQKAGE